MKITNEQQPVLMGGSDIALGKKIFYWAQALLLFAAVIAVGMVLIDWCVNLNLFRAM